MRWRRRPRVRSRRWRRPRTCPTRTSSTSRGRRLVRASAASIRARVESADAEQRPIVSTVGSVAYRTNLLAACVGAWTAAGAPRGSTLIRDFDPTEDSVALVDGAEIVSWRETGNMLNVFFANGSVARFLGLSEDDASFLSQDDSWLA